MTVLALTYYRAACDTCGIGYDDPGGDGVAAWEFPSDAVLAALDIGWLRSSEGDLTCPECLRCAICGEHPAWVGGPELCGHGQVLCDECEPELPSTAPAPQRRLPGLDRHLTVVGSKAGV